MAHDRKLVIGGVALTMARLKHAIMAPAMNQARNALENEMIRSGFLDGAPFRWVGLIIREGLVDEAEPHYQRIDKKDGELPLAIEVDTHRLLGASMDQAEKIFRRAALLSLVHAGEKYGLNVERMRTMLGETETEPASST